MGFILKPPPQDWTYLWCHKSITTGLACHDECLLFCLRWVRTDLCKAEIRNLEDARVVNQEIRRLLEWCKINGKDERTCEEENEPNNSQRKSVEKPSPAEYGR